MKIIIDIPKEVIVAIENGLDYRYDIHTAIAQGIPFEERAHGKWIPVGERLPENDMNVIFSIYNSEYCDPDIGFVEERLIVVAGDFQRIGGNRYWSWVDEYGDAVIKDEYCKEECGLESFITAWMPLPKPYKEANNE